MSSFNTDFLLSNLRSLPFGHSFMLCFFAEAQEGVKMTLDCAQATFIDNDKLVISLKGGEL
jgi:hypothetical protein